MPDRLLGILLFLPVPVVLVLFTRAPLGVGISLALGVGLMLTHRLYARPFALARADSLKASLPVAAGLIQLTLILYSPTSIAAVSVKPMMPNFETQ